MKIIKINEGAREEEVQCVACSTRFWLKKGLKKAKCPGCGVEWKISWSYPRAAKTRGSVWETYPTGDKI